MKIFKNAIIIALVLLMLPKETMAQNESKSKAYRVHVDYVKPSMTGEYENIVKELVNLLKKHNVQDVKWITLRSNDNRYSFVAPIKGMADLDKPSFVKTLVEKEGKEKITDLFDRMDKCYDLEQDYILHLDEELTYMPDGFTQTPEGMNYRNNHLLYVSPSNRTLLKEKMKSVKELFASKGSKMHYRVYKSGFGADGEHYMVAIAAKDPAHYEAKGAENDVLIGEEGQKVMSSVFSNLLKYDEIRGEIKPDLGYSPKKSI